MKNQRNLKILLIIIIGLLQIQFIAGYWTSFFGRHFFLSAGIAVIAIIILIVSLINSFISKRNRFFEYLSLVVVISSTIGFFTMRFQYSNRQDLASRKAYLINAALSRYQIENNAFPVKLKQLEPKYLKKVPKRNFGIQLVPFTYSTNIDSSSYILSYFDLFGESHWYNSENKEWVEYY